MGTEVLYPQDCLIQRIRFAPHRRKSYGNGNNRFRKVPVGPGSQRHRFDNSPSEPLISRRSSNPTRSGHVAGQVTILRRGEPLDQKIKAGDHHPLKAVSGAQNLGPDPVMSDQNRIRDPKLILADVYAGSAFSVSPAPSSLPLPSFFNKKQVSEIAVDDSATRDLRRLLRLE